MSFQVIFDCVDPARLAQFWSAALGYRRAETSPDAAGLLPPNDNAPPIAFFRVPEPKAVKNRVHLDLRVANLGDEVARLQALGQPSRAIASPRREPTGS